jgi:high-affinity Fe2+/Pb2+ permease
MSSSDRENQSVSSNVIAALAGVIIGVVMGIVITLTFLFAIGTLTFR